MFKEYLPKSFSCLREGYTKKLFFSDLLAGLSVGFIALPLALAFAIGSGVDPEKGLYTAIVAGFLISLLGGSRVQIGGPTGAFVIIIYSIVQRHGYDGLAIATLLAGVMIALLGLARGGILLKFIPYPVITGFTTGIALVIFVSQIKDVLELKIDSVSPEFLQKCKDYCLYAHTWNVWACSLSLGTLGVIFLLRRFYPRFPGVILAVLVASLIAYFFNLPVSTIEDKFGEIPRMLPLPSLPAFSYNKMIDVFPDAISIALLGAIESLLSALVADNMTGQRHSSNGELVAQGLANIGSIFFGGIPATGAIARTAANIKLGAKTPFAGMFHAITLLLIMVCFAPLASKIPLCVLSAVLVYIAWNMSEIPHFIEILKSRGAEAVVLVVTFLLTVLVDLTVAVQIGVILAALLFVRGMSSTSTIHVKRNSVAEDITVFEMKGPFFYAVSQLLEDALAQTDHSSRFFILNMQQVPLIDVTGVKALKLFSAQCKQKGVVLLISHVGKEVEQTLKKNNFEKFMENDRFFVCLNSALEFAKKG